MDRTPDLRKKAFMEEGLLVNPGTRVRISVLLPLFNKINFMDRPLSLSKGSIILCENGHQVATINRDIYKGDTGYSSAFDFEENQHVPTKAEPEPLRCHCGGIWFINFKCPYTK